MATNRWLGGYAGATTDVNQTGNWSTGAVPTTGDDVFVEANPAGTDYALDTSLTTLQNATLSSFNVAQTFTAAIGSASAYLLLRATTVNIGYQYGGASLGSGSGRIKLNLQSTATTVNVTNTSASPTDTGVGALQILSTATSNTFNITGGLISLAMTPGETSTVSSMTATGGNTQIFLGSGVTLTTLNLQGAAVQVQNGATTINMESGALYTYGAGAITTLNNWGGRCTLNSTGTITTLNVSGVADFTQSTATRTVTNCNCYGSGHSILLDNGQKNSVVFTNGIIGNNTRPNVVPWVTSTLTLA